MASATSSPRAAVKSPLAHLVIRRDAFVAQSSSDVANRALLRCHGEICWSLSDVYLFALLAACRMSFLFTVIEGKPTPGSGFSSCGFSVWVLIVGI